MNQQYRGETLDDLYRQVELRRKRRERLMAITYWAMALGAGAVLFINIPR